MDKKEELRQRAEQEALRRQVLQKEKEAATEAPNQEKSSPSLGSWRVERGGGDYRVLQTGPLAKDSTFVSRFDKFCEDTSVRRGDVVKIAILRYLTEMGY